MNNTHSVRFSFPHVLATLRRSAAFWLSLLAATTTMAAVRQHEAVFIDSTVPDISTLLAGLRPGVTVTVVSAGSDGLAEITAALANERDLDAVHIVAHASPGVLLLGQRRVDLAALVSEHTQLTSWRAALAPKGEIAIYGCELAAGETGARWLAELQAATGVNVAASTTLIGDSRHGGNWQLEAQLGSIRFPAPFSCATLAAYSGLLAASITNTTNGTTLTNTLVNGASGISNIGGIVAVGVSGQMGTVASGTLGTVNSATVSLTAPGIILSSGNTSATGDNVSQPGDSDVFYALTHTTGFSSSGTNDAASLSFTFETTPGTPSITLDLVYATLEFIGDTSYLDAGVVMVDGVNYAIFPNGNLLSNLNGAFLFATPFDVVTGFENISPVQHITALLNTGLTTHTIKIAIADNNDASADSAIIVSNLALSASTTGGIVYPPVVTSGLTASGTYGSAISTYTITGSNTPTSYSATGLPAGLSINTTNGQITGTPTDASGSPFNVTIGATNADGTGTATLVFTIAKAAQATLSVSSSASGTFNTTYTPAYTGGSGTGGLTWGLGTGSTAAGAAINSSSGAVTSTGAGTVVIKVTKATDTNYLSATSVDFTVTLAKASQAALSVNSSASGTFNTAYTATSTGGSGTGGLSWALAPSFATFSDNFANLSNWTTSVIGGVGGPSVTASGNKLLLNDATGAITSATSNQTFSGAFDVTLNFQHGGGGSVSQINHGSDTVFTYLADTSSHSLLISFDGAGNAISYLDGSITAYSTASGISTAADSINFTNIGGVGSVTQVYNLSITSTSSLSTAPGAAVDSSTGAVTSTGAGTVVVNVTKASDTNYLAATSADFTITLAAAQYADFNGDGKSDILWRNAATGDVVLWLMNGTTVSSTQVLATVSADWVIAGTGDFNGDGKTDILWRKTSTGAVGLWLMNGTSITSTSVIATVASPDWQIAGTGDFDSDGKVDILWRKTSTHAVALWLMNGATISSTSVIATVTSADWRISGTGDFDSDGKVDILWRKISTGAVAVWYMNGSTISSTGGIATVASADWQIVGTGDYDGDGDVDILWRKTSNSAVGLWIMNAAAISSTTVIGTAP